MNTPKFLILLSTYNGEKYLQEQLNSIQQQEEVDFHIFIRDDGSTDGTVSLIRQYMQSYPGQISLFEAENVGAKNSFFQLIHLAANEYTKYDFVAFCDQDDIWNSSKLNRAASLLGNENNFTPKMYCSTTQMVDSHLNKLNTWPYPPKKPLGMYNALVENVAVGCTTVLNKKAFYYLASNPPANTKNIIMHDWWSYLCISTFGTVVFDELPSILYRQHSNNALGGQTDNIFNKWRKRFHRYFKGQNHFIISNQAKEFSMSFQHLMNMKVNKDVQEFIRASESSIFSRFLYILQIPFYRQNMIDHCILKLITLLGKI